MGENLEPYQFDSFGSFCVNQDQKPVPEGFYNVRKFEGVPEGTECSV